MPKPVKSPKKRKMAVSKSKLKRKKGKSKSSREIIYDKVQSRLCLEANETGMTPEQAKEILGWREVAKGEPWLFRDHLGNKIMCDNNVTNRPLNMANVRKLVEEILHKNWELNGEPIILGKTGLVLNGQHTLIALVLASQILEEDPLVWDWDDANVTLDKLIVVGINESDKVVNTLDTAKPRTLCDVIFRSVYFQGVDKSQRRRLSKLTEVAVKLLWIRAKKDGGNFGSRVTHADAIQFLDHHPRLLECVRFVYEEDGAEGRLGKFFRLGQVAAIMYIMAASKTDRTKYDENPDESLMDLSNFDKAKKFMEKLHSSEEMKPFRKAVAACDEESPGFFPRLAVFVNGWEQFLAGKKITEQSVRPKYHKDEDGFLTLASTPNFGGIDLGDPTSRLEIDPDDEEIIEIEERVEKERTRKTRKGGKS